MRTVIANKGPTENSGCTLRALAMHSNHALTVGSNTSSHGKLIFLASNSTLFTVAFGVAVIWLKFLLLDIATYKNDIYVWIYENGVRPGVNVAFYMRRIKY